MGSEGASRPAEFDEAGVDRRRVSEQPPQWAVFDLFLAIVVVALTLALVFVYGARGGPTIVRVPLGVLFVFFLPGYALSAALFPGRGGLRDTSTSSPTVTLLERGVLAVGLSVALVPLVSIGLTMVSYPIGPRSALSSFGVLTVGLCVVAALRRLRLPADERASVSPTRGLQSSLAFLRADSLNVVIVVLLVLVAAGIGAAVLTSEDASAFTEIALLGEDADGEFVAGEYPDELTPGDVETLYLQIENREGRTVEYTAVGVLEVRTSDGEWERLGQLDQFDVTLEHDRREVYGYDVEAPPEVAGETVRVTTLLYLDSVPDVPDRSSAYRSAHVTFDVASES